MWDCRNPSNPLSIRGPVGKRRYLYKFWMIWKSKKLEILDNTILGTSLNHPCTIPCAMHAPCTNDGEDDEKLRWC